LAGIVLAKMGETSESIELLRRCLPERPEDFEANLWLSRLLRKLGRNEEAVSHAEVTHRVRPTDAHGVLNLGLTYLAGGRGAEAEASLLQALQGMRPSAPLYHHLGRARRAQGKYAEALEAFSAALALDTNSVETLTEMVEVLALRGEFHEAISRCRQALALRPDLVAARHTLIESLLETRQAEEAGQEIERLVTEHPNDAKAAAMKGTYRMVTGGLEEAVQAFERSIRLYPKQGFAYNALAQARKVTEPEFVETMRGVLADPSLNDQGRCSLHYGIGKALDDLGQYGEAMEEFDEANRLAYRLKFGDRQLDRSEVRRLNDWRKSLRPYKLPGKGDVTPVLIVGMIRSGTTLVEQILSSHPEVTGLGERRFWPSRWREGVRDGNPDADALIRLGREYVDSLGSDSPVAIDKMPGNYAHLGLIYSAVPGVKIIHVHRNPLDNALSIYMTPNSAFNEIAHDRSNIVFGYNEYWGLMGHWRLHLAPEDFLEISYEELVADQEAVTRSMIEFLGLRWDPACLRPEANPKSVATPSVWQVRQPVYTTSTEKWRRYMPWLREFRLLMD